MTVLEAIRKRKDVIVETLKWPYVKKMIKRGFEAVSDDLQIKRDETETRLIELRAKLITVSNDVQVKNIVNQIIDVKTDLEAYEMAARIAEDEAKYLESKAEEFED